MGQQQGHSAQEIDIDSIEVEVLIICKNPAAFQQSASYLSRRGWPTTVVGNLSKAIDYIVKHNPDYVLISLNHPNTNTFRLPVLLTQGMNVECIAFAETGDVGTTAKLAATNFKNKLQGLPSGPNIQRMIRRLLMEMLELNKVPEEVPSFVTDADPVPKPKFKIKDIGDDVIEGGKYTMGRQKDRKRLKDLRPGSDGRQPQAGKSTKEMPSAEKAELMKLAKEHGAKGESGMMFMPSAGDDIASENHVVIQKGGGKSEMKSALQKGPGANSFSVVQEGPDSKASGRPQIFTVDKPVRGSKKYQALFEKSVEEALARTCVSAGEKARKLGAVNFVAALPVDSPELHGYLVISISGVAPDLQLEVLRSFRTELSTLMAEFGVPAVTEEAFVVEMETFEYLEWVKNEAEMAFITDHQGAEVGVSFFATEERLPQPGETEKRDMATIKIQEIEPEQAVPFKAYLHFKRSDRLYLYLRNGRKLYQDQKDRLLSHKVGELYIKSIDINNFKNYSATNFLTRTSRKFRNKRTG